MGAPRLRWAAMKYRTQLLAFSVPMLLTALTGVAAADPWAVPGEGRLRHDLQLLADAGLVRAPLTAWPVSWGEVSRDLSGQDVANRPPHVAAAVARVRAAAAEAMRTGDWRMAGRVAASGNPMALRRFSDVPREEAELEGALQYTGDVLAMRLQATVVANPDDDKDVRADGSYVGAALGNWMLSAGLVDRWWGPGWEGSLIYGTNQRPIPAVTLERDYSDPFETKWLSWIGRWRLVLTMGQLEEERTDYPDTLFYGMRITWKPHDRLEIGLSRSAQWCGDGRPCSWDTFWDLFRGNDNDQALEDQPGNQMAGVDFRWSVPWAPFALYGQYIGEDEAGGFPSKYLGLFGAESWGGWGDKSWRVHVEYADTACDFPADPPEFGCAYRNGIYTDGYQYRNRSIGHGLDGDSEQIAFGVVLVDADGSSWEVATQAAKLNREGVNAVHSVSAVPLDLVSADLYHSRGLLGGTLKLGLGYERRDSDMREFDEDGVRGFLQWSRQM